MWCRLSCVLFKRQFEAVAPVTYRGLAGWEKSSVFHNEHSSVRLLDLLQDEQELSGRMVPVCVDEVACGVDLPNSSHGTLGILFWSATSWSDGVFHICSCLPYFILTDVILVRLAVRYDHHYLKFLELSCKRQLIQYLAGGFLPSFIQTYRIWSVR